MENEDVMCDGEIELSDRAKSLWGKTNRVDDTEWLPLYVHMADSAAMAVRIWDTWVPCGTKSIISRDLGNDDDLARKLMIFLAGVHDIGKATPVFQAKPISFGPDAESLAWKPEQAGLPMIAGLRDTSHPAHPIAGQVIPLTPLPGRSFSKDIFHWFINGVKESRDNTLALWEAITELRRIKASLKARD